MTISIGWSRGGKVLLESRGIEPHFFWFRFFGYGLHFRWVLDDKYKGLTKTKWKIGKLWIRVLNKSV